jgi:hypothetical protein
LRNARPCLILPQQEHERGGSQQSEQATTRSMR